MDIPPPLPETPERPQSIPPAPCWPTGPGPSELRNARRVGCLQGCFASIAVFFVVTIVLPLIAVLVLGRSASRTESLFRDHSEEDADFTGDASGLREVFVATVSPDEKTPSEPSGAEEEEKASDSAKAPSSGDGDKELVFKAVRIPLSGTIDLSGGDFGEEGDTETALRSIRRATEDPDVDAILLLVDSGGGGITASDILYNALREFRASDPNRRIVVLMGDMACSGAYYASLPADRILAHPTTITGSIGVILPSYNVRQLADKLGIADVSIQSGENKSILNPMRDLTDAQRAMLQQTVDELHARFTSLVVLHRGLPAERVKALADGRIYTARQALGHKLIDDIGYLADAENAVVSLLGGKHPVEFYEYEHKLSLRDLFATPSFWGSVLQRALPTAAAPSPSGPQAR